MLRMMIDHSNNDVDDNSNKFNNNNNNKHMYVFIQPESRNFRGGKSK